MAKAFSWMAKIPILLGNGLYQEWFWEKESQNTSMVFGIHMNAFKVKPVMF